MTDRYVLDAEHRVVPCRDLMWWAEEFEKSDRTVGRTRVAPGVLVSTVFLGLDHRFGSAPIVFETLVFGGAYSDEGDRYCTWAEAEAGHAVWVEKASHALAASFVGVVAAIPEQEIPF